MSTDWKLAAKQHFLNDRSPEKLVPIKVPEWGTAVYYWPAQTMGERRAISLAYESAPSGDALGGVVEVMMVRARNEYGQLLFNESERADLLERYDPKILNRIVAAMNSPPPSTVEDAEKNS